MYRSSIANQVDSVTGGESEDVGAGDGGPAGRLDLRLDGVDHLEPADRVGVRPGGLLTVRAVQQERAVASLSTKQKIET